MTYAWVGAGGRATRGKAHASSRAGQSGIGWGDADKRGVYNYPGYMRGLGTKALVCTFTSTSQMKYGGTQTKYVAIERTNVKKQMNDHPFDLNETFTSAHKLFYFRILFDSHILVRISPKVLLEEKRQDRVAKSFQTLGFMSRLVSYLVWSTNRAY